MRASKHPARKKERRVEERCVPKVQTPVLGSCLGFSLRPRPPARDERAPTLSPTPCLYRLLLLQVQQQNQPDRTPITQSSTVSSTADPLEQTHTHARRRRRFGSSLQLHSAPALDPRHSSVPTSLHPTVPHHDSQRPPRTPTSPSCSSSPHRSLFIYLVRLGPARYRRSPPRSELRSKPPPPSKASSPSSHHVVRDP